ncbi:MAG: type II toxin-antitoxin system RelB/DinJ family antitoxin [Steroidobacteraceae bacterium]
MKTEIVRARIDANLKADAGEVLHGLGLEMSDAIRLFLRQLVQHRGLPFDVRNGGPKVVSAKRLWAMKRAGQAQSRHLAASGAVPPEAVFLLRGEQVAQAKMRWPDAPLSAAAAEREEAGERSADPATAA